MGQLEIEQIEEVYCDGMAISTVNYISSRYRSAYQVIGIEILLSFFFNVGVKILIQVLR